MQESRTSAGYPFSISSCFILSSSEPNLVLEQTKLGSPFGRYPAFHTLTSVGRKKLFSMSRNVAAFSCCTNDRRF